MSGRSPPLYCTLTLIAMQGHQTKCKNKQKIYCFIGRKDKATTWHLNGFLVVTLGQQYNVGESPPLYCTLILIAMQGHQKNKTQDSAVLYIVKRVVVVVHTQRFWANERASKLDL